ncbi:MAG: glycoside hydrolase family 3 C-terminal domain-containing protein [Melioribacteraceae bacterium]|nr:glycoside hydrolase family 3 C-terminal domain-containing protein [Melioribacteraceae bacterium]
MTSENNIIAQQSNSIKLKVEKILDQLSLDEKISMLHGNSKFTISGVKRLGIPEWKMSDGPHGVREEINRHNWEPVGLDDDFATYLPVGTALSATWNPELAYKFGSVLGREARARNKDIILGPGINIHRTPLCGRNFEYMSEDPYLIRKLVVPYINGVQDQDVAACVKHFAANNQEYERFRVNAEIDERTLREIYLPGFKAAFTEAKALTAMTAYNKFRGKWCSENDYLLNEILRQEWKWDGVVISDWNGTHSTIDAANAGLDIEMGTEKDYDDYYFADALKEAVENGDLAIETINAKVRRILTVMHQTKVFDSSRSKGEFISERNFEVAKEVAEEAVVLLKNENTILPLDLSKIKSLAVIGENATRKHAIGGGSSGIKAKYEITPLEGLQNKLGDKVKINFAEGYKSSTKFDWSKGRVDTSDENFSYRKNLRNEAVGVAAESDYVILFMGLNHDYDMESVDRTEMILPYQQDELVKEILKANKNVIVVLIGGLALDLREWVNEVPAILQGWYAGSEAGNVFADILLGDVNPSGKLPFTFPKKLEDSPAYKFGDIPGNGLEVEYKEGIFVGYRYFDSYNVVPQFAFGHGLSYTTFNYSKVELSKNILNKSKTVDVFVTIENTGKVAGSEVIQLYIEDVVSSVERPKKELKGFEKIYLKSGETKEVKFQIDESILSFYDVESKNFKAEPGQFKIHIGSASDDIRLTTEFELSKEN